MVKGVGWYDSKTNILTSVICTNIIIQGKECKEEEEVGGWVRGGGEEENNNN